MDGQARRTRERTPRVQRGDHRAAVSDSVFGLLGNAVFPMRAAPGNGIARTPLFASALAQTGRFAFEAAQVVELGATGAAGAHDVDMVDHRGVQREDALNAGAEAGLADGNGLAHAGVVAADRDTLEGLQAFLVAFPDLHVDADGIADPELRKVHSLILIQDLLQIGVDHGLTPFLSNPTLRQRDLRPRWPADPVSAGSFSRAPPAGATCGSPRGGR